MRISLCVGKYATTPYFIAGMEVPIYSMEELCICIKENAFFIDNSLMNEELAEWVKDRCGLEEFARILGDMIRTKEPLHVFVRKIMEYTGLYEETIIREIEEVLKRSAGRSSFEKRKERIDYLIAKKKYAAAVRGYDSLLDRWEDLKENESEGAAVRMQAAVLHNKGVAYAGMMQYEAAAREFLKAYELTGEMAEQVSFLAAKRMLLSESEYVAFVSTQPDAYSGTLQLEKQMDALRKDWEQQADHQRLSMRKQMRAGAEKQQYYNESERLIQALEENYRDCMELN